MDGSGAMIMLTPDSVVALINLVKSLLDRSHIRQTNFKDNLTILKTDLGIVNDVLIVIQRRNRRNLPDGTKDWEAEASRVVRDAQELVRRINNKNDRADENGDGPQPRGCLWFRRNDLCYNRRDADDLERLRKRLDGITKHNETVLALLRDSRRCCLL